MKYILLLLAVILNLAYVMAAESNDADAEGTKAFAGSQSLAMNGPGGSQAMGQSMALS